MTTISITSFFAWTLLVVPDKHRDLCMNWSRTSVGENQMKEWFQVDHLDVELLLSEWRWLCPGRMELVARNAFGDLFLRDGDGAVFWLNVAIGRLTKVSDSEAAFHEMAGTAQKREEWFAEADTQAAARRGLRPSLSQCIAFAVPLVFAERPSPDKAYIADLYESVSFLGDLHRQISSLPDGSKIELRVTPPSPRTK